MEGINTSSILGDKLNYIYNNLVKIRQPTYFAFLDQDMFMFRDFKIISFLDKYGMWGDLNEPSNYKTPSLFKKDIVEGPWYLHPWLSFYKFDFIKNENMNFCPCEHADTGGSNWLAFISKRNELKKSDYWFLENIVMMYPFKEISDAGPPLYEDEYFTYNNKTTYGQIQINNGFIHMLNSHSHPLHPKVAYIQGFLESALYNNL